MIAAAPELPSDDPSMLAVITGILAALVICFFGFWVLGGYRFFIGRPASWTRLWEPLRPTLLIVLAMFVAVGLFLGAVWLQDRERDAAWDRYDDQLNQQENTVEAP
jgi:high-affinity Fe2+/Pb2+ permease